MPNWCNNIVTLQHKDPQLVQRVAEAFERCELFSEFLPVPEHLKNTEGRYDWVVANWGVKWEVGEDEDEVTHDDDNTISFSFGSAWSPPIKFYEHLVSLGFKIEAHYFEPGCCFFGTYLGQDYEGNEFTIDFGDMDSSAIEAEYPEHNERWNISEYIDG